MSITAEKDADLDLFALDPADSDSAAVVAQRLCAAASGGIDDQSWVDLAREHWHQLPLGLRTRLSRFRRYSGPLGTHLIRNLPVGALPATPTVPMSVQREPDVPAAMLMMVACGLGDPAAFRQEKSGALVQNVVPVPGMEKFQGNAGSVLLNFHTENAFHDHRPDFVMLLCVRPDHERVAGLRVACSRTILPQLSPMTRETLFSAEFRTAPPPSFNAADPDGDTHAVLFGDPDDPDLRVDLAATEPLTSRAADALDTLRDLFDRTAPTLRLAAGDLAIVDNRVTVHGRTSFAPRYDGQDRWLQRTFVLADVRRSRGLRPGDGHVITD